jgi:hypothetical protein
MTETDHIVEQRSVHQEPKQQDHYPYYALFIALYNALFGAFLLLYRRQRHSIEQVTPLDLAMLGLSTLRLSKAVSQDEVTQVLRDPLVTEEEGQPKPAGRGFRYSLGKLMLCPTCTGTWIAAFLGYSLHLFPHYTRPFLTITSASGISQFGDALLSLIYADRNVLKQQEEQQERG